MAIRHDTGQGLGLGMLLCLAGGAAGAFEIEAGISGSWYDPAQDGHGFLVEVLAGGRLAAYWFTYDGQGNQAWLAGVGTIQGNTATVPVILTRGGVFGPAFEPGAVDRQGWGSLTFTFDSCDTGSVAYNVGFGAGTLALRRLTRPEGLVCDRSAEPARYPFDGPWTGSAVASTLADAAGGPCADADFTLDIDHHQVSGGGATRSGFELTLGGRVDADGGLALGFAIGPDTAATLQGRLSKDAGSGTWEDAWGCAGTWSLTRRL